MKRHAIAVTAVTLGIAATALTPFAHAGNIGFGLTIGGPGYAVSVGNGGGGWFAPGPVYVSPPPVHYTPPPVYFAPRPVYVAPPVVYVQPRRYVVAPVVVHPPVRHTGYRGPGARPVVVAPRWDDRRGGRDEGRHHPKHRPSHSGQVAWGY